MNAQRLANVANIIAADLGNGHLVKLVSQLVSHVQAAIDSPSEATQRQAEATLNQLAVSLAGADSNTLSPGLRADLRELSIGGTGVEDLLGERLLEQIRSVLSSGYISVAALDSLKKIAEDVGALHTAIQSLRIGLNKVGIEEELLSDGEAIAGITVPRGEVDNELGRLKKEITFFDNAIRHLAECVGEPATPNKVNSLRSSDFGIDLDTTVKVASLLAFIVKGVAAGLEKLKGYRELKAKAQALNVSPKGIETIVEESRESMEATKVALHAEVFKRYRVRDDGRNKELENGVRFVIDGVASRLDRGFTFEVRASLPADPSPEHENQLAPITALAAMRFEPVAGPTLLELNSADGGESSETKDNVKPKAPKPKRAKRAPKQAPEQDRGYRKIDLAD